MPAAPDYDADVEKDKNNGIKSCFIPHIVLLFKYEIEAL